MKKQPKKAVFSISTPTGTLNRIQAQLAIERERLVGMGLQGELLSRNGVILMLIEGALDAREGGDERVMAYWDGYRQAAETVLDTIIDWGGVDGAHHKQWVLDLIVRKMTNHNPILKKYDEWVREYESGEDGPETYLWDQGIAP